MVRISFALEPSIPPYNLTAVNISSTSVILTWQVRKTAHLTIEYVFDFQYPSIYICNESMLKFAIEITDRYNRTITQSHDSYSRMSTINQLKSFTYYTVVIYAINDFGSSPKSEPLNIQTIESGRFHSLIRLINFLCISVPLAMIVDLTGHLLNSSTAFITWTFSENDHQLLNGKFRTFAVTIYENFSKDS